MKIAGILSMALSFCICCFAANASDVFEATPIEQGDVNTLADISGGATSEAYEATPAEQGGIHTIDQLNN